MTKDEVMERLDRAAKDFQSALAEACDSGRAISVTIVQVWDCNTSSNRQNIAVQVFEQHPGSET